MHDRLGTETQTGIPLRLRDVRRVFDTGVVAVDGVSLDIRAGEFLALLGPSGCGKSTLLRAIAGLDPVNSGSIEIETGSGLLEYASTRHTEVAYVFQDAHLLPWRSVLRNVALPLELLGVSKARRLAAASAAIEQVGLAEFTRAYPAQLSGGMRMRVSLARALVTNPRLLLLDEPFAALDEITRQRLDEQLRDLWARRGMTVIFVTHSITEAAYLAQRAVVLSSRPAKVRLDHRLDLPARRDESLRTEARFAKEMRVLFDALEGREVKE